MTACLEKSLRFAAVAACGTLAVMVLVGAALAQEPEPPRLAIVPWEARGASDAQAEAVAEQMRAAFTQSGKYIVVDRTHTQQILDELRVQHSGLTDAEQAVEFGKLLNVDFIVTGKLIRLGDAEWLLSATMLETESGVTVKAETLPHQGGFFPLLGEVEGVASQLAGVVQDAHRITNAMTWERALGGNGDDIFHQAVPLDGGGLLVVGLRSFGANGSAGWVVRLDDNGAVLWGRVIGGQDHRNVIHSSVVMDDKSFFLVGESGSSHDATNDGWAMRIDHGGKELWTGRFGGSLQDGFRFVHRLGRGQVLLAGSTWPDGGESFDGWVVNLDHNEEIAWAKTFGQAQSDWFRCVETWENGDILLAGASIDLARGLESDRDLGVDAWVVRLRRSGEKVWDRSFHEGERDQFTAAIAHNDGGALLIGWTYSIDVSNAHGLLFRIDADGNPLWKRVLRSRGRSIYLESATQLQDGDYIIAGSILWDDQEYPDALDGWLARIDRNGRVVWERTYGGHLEDRFVTVASWSDGAITVAGASSSGGPGEISNAGGRDGWVLKLDSEGRLR